MLCKACGRNIDDDSRFCEHCGANVSGGVSHPSTQKKFCGECGRVIDDDSKFCEHCGASVSGGMARPSTQKKFCGECGGRLDEDSFFCERCGTKVTGEGMTPSESGGRTVIVDRGAQADPGTSGETVIVSRSQLYPGSGGQLPSKFGRYVVTKELGRGSMGVVYLARDDQIGRDVAIKAIYLDSSLSAGEQKERLRRFTREARIAGNLTHPNVITIYDVGEDEGTAWIAMEYLEGQPLSEVISEGLSIDQAVDIVSQVLSALSYAHGKDVVHRDIKPDNIFLLSDGRVKVADFGIARVASSGTMTQVGLVLGTPGYMSPEQVKGLPAEPASDLFSVGVLFYELVTGIKPFDSDSTTSIMYKIVHEEPEPLHIIKSGIPPHINEVISRAIRKDPQERYSSAAEMKDDLLAK